MPQQFRLAIIGAGLISESSHVPAALASMDISLDAIVDPVTARATALARKFGVNPTIAADIGAIAGKVDGAVIATPNHTHKDIALRCIDAGVPVLIEKPLASSYADGLAILEAAERRRVTVAVGTAHVFARTRSS